MNYAQQKEAAFRRSEGHVGSHLALRPLFAEVPLNDDFISPEGSWCRKVSATHARMMDDEDNCYRLGELVPFNGGERVEYAPRNGTMVPVR